MEDDEPKKVGGSTYNLEGGTSETLSGRPWEYDDEPQSKKTFILKKKPWKMFYPTNQGELRRPLKARWE